MAAALVVATIGMMARGKTNSWINLDNLVSVQEWRPGHQLDTQDGPLHQT